jgi:acyl-CoA thioester hydrolase
VRIHEEAIRVRYCETDKMGVVHHSSYINFFEIGRTEYLRGLGVAYSEIEKTGVRLVVAEINCKYKANAYYDEQILIRTWISELTKVRVCFEYKIHRLPDNKLLVSGKTILACVDMQGKPCRIPAKIYNLLKEHL